MSNILNVKVGDFLLWRLRELTRVLEVISPKDCDWINTVIKYSTDPTERYTQMEICADRKDRAGKITIIEKDSVIEDLFL